MEDYEELKNFYDTFHASFEELKKEHDICKKFYEKYKDSIEHKKALNKKYYEEGLKDAVVYCSDCGVSVKRLCMSNHQKTKKHIKNVEIKELKEKLQKKEMFFMVKM